MRPRYEFDYSRVVVEQDGDEAWLTEVRTEPVRRDLGQMRRLMATVLNDADEQGITLWLTPTPEPGAMPKGKLVAWYERLGFEWATPPVLPSGLPGYMKREPKAVDRA